MQRRLSRRSLLTHNRGGSWWSERLRRPVAILWICMSVCLVSGPVFLGLKISQKMRNNKLKDPRFAITTLVQTGPHYNALPTPYLSFLLDLSSDAPKSLHAIDVHLAEKALLASPLIKEAKVEKYFPNTLYIDYSIRTPIALLGDFEGVGIDVEGVAIPFKHFFSPKNLPEIYLGTKAPLKFEKITSPEMTLALEIYHLLRPLAMSEDFSLKRVDVSNAFNPSYGRREIVLVLEDLYMQKQEKTTFHQKRYVRLPTRGYDVAIGNFMELRKELVEGEKQLILSNPRGPGSINLPAKTIDLRMGNQAYLDVLTH